MLCLTDAGLVLKKINFWSWFLLSTCRGEFLLFCKTIASVSLQRIIEHIMELDSTQLPKTVSALEKPVQENRSGRTLEGRWKIEGCIKGGPLGEGRREQRWIKKKSQDGSYNYITATLSIFSYVLHMLRFNCLVLANHRNLFFTSCYRCLFSKVSELLFCMVMPGKINYDHFL